jgi:hypothetical protein
MRRGGDRLEVFKTDTQTQTAASAVQKTLFVSCNKKRPAQKSKKKISAAVKFLFFFF